MVVTSTAGTQTNLTARQAVVVCTGSQAAIPDVPGLAEARPWTNHEAVGARTGAASPGDPRRRGGRL